MMEKTILELPGFTLILFLIAFHCFIKRKYLFSSWLHAGSSSVGLPSKWKPMKSDQTMMEVTLRQGDKEYNDVLSHFQTSAGGSVKVSEVKINLKYLSEMHVSICVVNIH